MVLSRRFEYGFNGYQVPSMPRAARSARRRSSAGKNVEDPKLCAFDLLATLAGNLLAGKSSSGSTSNSSTQIDNRVINDLNGEEGCVDQSDRSYPQQSDRSSNEKEIANGLIILPDSDEAKSNPYSFDIQASDGDVLVKPAGTTNAKDQSERLGVDMSSSDQGTESERVSDLVGDGPPVLAKVEDASFDRMKVESYGSAGAPYCSEGDVYSLKDHVTCDIKTLAQHSSNNGSQVLVCENKDQVSLSSFPVENGVVVVSRDDDDNSSGCTHPSIYKKPFRSAPYIGDRRIRKVLASQNCKVIPRYKNKFQRPGGLYQAHCRDNDRWLNYQRNFPFKKRKFYDMDRQSFSDKEIKGRGQDNICRSRKSWKEDCSDRFTSLAVQRSSMPDVDSSVKLRIESLRVPEMLIEIPETATIGALKRAVVDAVIRILGGGLHVGVLLQGKKVGDDSKTLQQTGIISPDRALNALGFMLEPDPEHCTPPVSPGSSSLLFHCDAPQPLTRYPDAPTKVQPGTTTSPMNMLTKVGPESKALVPATPSMEAGALSAVPIHGKSEIAQRRIRRPFSVAEVEALVQAVEKLGTGRWRDVKKLRAFDTAKHRTYVDLKDKWKTLVHTARITPQQRRGEPVPQELLDRVLTAHAYWAQQQQQSRHHQLL